MNQNYIIENEWSILEEGFDPKNVTASESIFSIGNGVMGQRANFEEKYSGETFQGSYIGGVYYPDKTRVGWWKNGYPEYFAKVLNAPNWIGIHVLINGVELDLNTANVSDFKRELNMKEGWLQRSFQAELSNGNIVKVNALRFLSMTSSEIGAIRYSVTPLNFSGEISYTPYLDGGISNEDTNYDELFWEVLDIQQDGNYASVLSKTLKTEYHVSTGMQIELNLGGKQIVLEPSVSKQEKSIALTYTSSVSENETFTIYKYGGYVHSMNYSIDELNTKSKQGIHKATAKGFETLLEEQIVYWAKAWETADIVIEGDVKAQQAIRFNIFQLSQTYTGEDSRLNIGPKGFTGEKYGGSTYWDTEAYCIPFYMRTKDPVVARNLLVYRHNQLGKAIENAEKLGFTNGAALYPMVTMNGEECHNEWEITFEEIHRNGAMIYAINNYVNYTGDYSYIPELGMEVMIGVARFWHQRATFSEDKDQFVILGVTGPNEYENNINNNFYTNYLAKWCIEYAVENLKKIEKEYTSDYSRIIALTNLTVEEIEAWLKVSSNMYFPYSEKHEVFLQQDGFLDKELIPVSDLSKENRPINQKWSWDRILRSCYIKQADVLQGFYMFENQFNKEEIEKHFDFYEPITVHESSLSPCIHSILAASIDRMPKAYEQYLRTSRLDLDDYNHEVHEGLHITSMAGTWMSIVEGFGGMRVWDDARLTFNPQIPQEWKSYSFKINFRGSTLMVEKTQNDCKFTNESDKDVTVYMDDKEFMVPAKENVIVVGEIVS
ncbi:glycoside hydrolase family 65 protein [Flavicella sp.]|uniref:glycoside hydrolase family 65 protein n=1 Tax=Flavicella sp. TaxID=2957742 RepID=UPI002622A880|nr:glycoside hydrolase family 65 protein [Flavicella sp.]MDG1804503.1 glycoside hydrolase family 65 protein [Flavicella sp.]